MSESSEVFEVLSVASSDDAIPCAQPNQRDNKYYYRLDLALRDLSNNITPILPRTGKDALLALLSKQLSRAVERQARLEREIAETQSDIVTLEGSLETIREEEAADFIGHRINFARERQERLQHLLTQTKKDIKTTTDYTGHINYVRERAQRNRV